MMINDEYERIKGPLNYWRSTSQFEVDFILNNEVAIEVKSSKEVSSPASSKL